MIYLISHPTSLVTVLPNIANIRLARIIESVIIINNMVKFDSEVSGNEDKILWFSQILLFIRILFLGHTSFAVLPT